MKHQYSSLIILAIIPFMTCCNARSGYIIDSGEIWHTAYHIKYDAPKSLLDSIRSIFNMVDSSLSVFNDSSIVSKVNRNEIIKTQDSLFVTIFKESRRVCENSGGAFDPTLSPLIDLWGFGKASESTHRPTPVQIDSVMNLVGLGECKMDSAGNIIKKHRETSFNFSAIAKGYACDLIGEMFKRNGVANFMIEIGGEVVVSGVNETGMPWRIFIESPVAQTDKSGITGSTVSVTDCAIASSGSYRNYSLSGDSIISHLINPTIGYPIRTTTLSVTVICQSCMKADALATACMILPLNEAVALIGKENAQARFTTLEHGEIRIFSTPEFTVSGSGPQ